MGLLEAQGSFGTNAATRVRARVSRCTTSRIRRSGTVVVVLARLASAVARLAPTHLARARVPFVRRCCRAPTPGIGESDQRDVRLLAEHEVSRDDRVTRAGTQSAIEADQYLCTGSLATPGEIVVFD